MTKEIKYKIIDKIYTVLNETYVETRGCNWQEITKDKIIECWNVWTTDKILSVVVVCTERSLTIYEQSRSIFITR